jgi:hypothetical protein
MYQIKEKVKETVRKETHLKFYNVFVVLLSEYAVECWTLNKQDEKKRDRGNKIPECSCTD